MQTPLSIGLVKSIGSTSKKYQTSMDNFALHLKFNTAADLTEDLSGHSVMLLQSVSLVDGATRAKVFLTVNGTKFVICNLNSARNVTAKLGLRIAKEDGSVVISCSQGANVVVSGIIESDSCCDHDHHDHGEEVECSDSEAPMLIDNEEVQEEDDEEEEEEDDEDDEEDDEDDEEDDEEEEEDEDEEDESIPSEDEIVSAKPTPTKDVKKVTFNKSEQGPHTPVGSVAPVKPVLKKEVAPASRVGTTLSLPGGLKYTILKEGRGPVAAYGKRVHVRYVGCLASNGKQFDKGQIKFRLGAGEVIDGWDKGVKDMKVGESRRLLIPANLGYGKRGAPPAIPGNAALAFEVELIDLQ